ncbi:signal recognition particle-docking protein FtsY [bacterium]|nr:signal recognition particle-docking protein FtsY [bacterium]
MIVTYLLITLAFLVPIFLFLLVRQKLKAKPSASLVMKSSPGLLSGLFKGGESTLVALEEKLLAADFGIESTQVLLTDMGSYLSNPDEAQKHLQQKMKTMLADPQGFAFSPSKPHVLMMVGINGVGKTTTLAKLAHWAVGQSKKVLLVAADTFRAAAAEQLETWATRSGAQIVRGNDQTDPASLVFDGIKKALATDVDLVLIDTAGRLHTKSNLMEELKKMVRVGEKSLGRALDDIYLVLDATTGQNGLSQARDFLGAIPLTGIVLTKFDGTAKGGIVFAIRQKTGLPIRFVGMGEGMVDLKPFDATDFIDKIFH